jgi:hypothetical protein
MGRGVDEWEGELGARYQVSGVRYRVSGIGCQVSGVRCQVSGIGQSQVCLQPPVPDT